MLPRAGPEWRALRGDPQPQEPRSPLVREGLAGAGAAPAPDALVPPRAGRVPARSRLCESTVAHPSLDRGHHLGAELADAPRPPGRASPAAETGRPALRRPGT